MTDALADIDFNGMMSGMAQVVPFIGTVGVEHVSMEPGRAVVRLIDRPEIHNHVGSLHAGALFTAGETASGSAFIGAFADQLADVLPLAASSEITYVAMARGDVEVEAVLGPAVDEIRDELSTQGLVRFPVGVTMRDADGKVVVEMTVHWHVRQRRG